MGWKNIKQTFDTTGNVTFNNFGWLFEDSQVAAIVQESYDMYMFHQRRIDGQPNLGWLRNMYHSLVQQAIRTDIQY